MASSEVEMERSDHQLKHLGFVRILAVNAVVLVSDLYEMAKLNSGPLTSTIEAVENGVTAVVGPVYERVKGIPSDLLVFVDQKVDDAVHKYDESVPPVAKNALSKVQLLVTQALQTAQDLMEEAKISGPLAAISHAGKISQHFAVSQLAFVWYKVNQHPVLTGVAKMAIPTAAHWSEKYNEFVKDMSAKGHALFNYVPLIPVEELVKAYKQAESAANKKGDTASTESAANEKGDTAGAESAVNKDGDTSGSSGPDNE